ncbi:hypothetical protein ES319_D08G259600v1 [Gossypium barbadense]|uniref:SHSP domain-containing protein n=1 Tax=Gossypium barbadense TaxID=3634 RepID=A0A5J5QQC3_GOSBA|nr:hypothetical protein ES319_D08G259600v1 [Gossypium barbadense]
MGKSTKSEFSNILEELWRLVEIHSSGILEISGERLMDEGKSKRIISRFRKEFPVSEDYQRTQIRAKFYNGILHLVMPKQIIPTISAPAGGGGDENNDDKASSSGTSYLTCSMKLNKNIALEIMILAISLAIVVAYVKKYCQCSSFGISCTKFVISASYNMYPYCMTEDDSM